MLIFHSFTATNSRKQKPWTEMTVQNIFLWIMGEKLWCKWCIWKNCWKIKGKSTTRTRQDFQDNECKEKQNSTKVYSAHTHTTFYGKIENSLSNLLYFNNAAREKKITSDIVCPLCTFWYIFRCQRYVRYMLNNCIINLPKNKSVDFDSDSIFSSFKSFFFIHTHS